MAVSNVTPRIEYTANGSNTRFAFTFVVPANTDPGSNINTISNVSGTASSNVLTTTDQTFTTEDVGKVIVIIGAGSGGATLNTTVLSFSNSNAVVLSDDIVTTVSNTTANITTGLFGTTMKDTGDLEVYVDGTLQTYTTDYTVTLNSGDESNKQGNVDFVSAPANASAIVIKRDIELERTTDFQTAGAFKATTVNQEFDTIIMAVQDARLDTDQSAIKFPTDESPNTTFVPSSTNRANKLFAFDGSGEIVVRDDITTGNFDITGTNITATTGFTGDLTGDVTGNVTGNIISSGTSSFNGRLNTSNLWSSLVDINGGTIDGTSIGLGSSAAGSFTSIYSSNVNLDGGTIDGIRIGHDSAANVTATNLTASGNITLNSLKYPNTDGSFNQVLSTDGAGNLAFRSISGLELFTSLTDTPNSYTGQDGKYLKVDTANNEIVFDTLTTDDVTEGTNLYFTAARARANISVLDNGGDGSLGYNSSTGVITYTGPSAAEVRAHFSGGTGVDITNGVVSIGQPVGTTDNVTFNDMTVSGNLTVSGTTTTVNTETINLADNQILLNSNYSGSSPTENAGIEINRGGGSAPNKTLVWDETADKWSIGTETFVAGTVEANITGNVIGDITGDITGNVTGNITGDVTGNLTGNVTGDLTGNVTGDVTGNLTGNVTGDLTGNVTGDLTGNTAGTHTGNVTGDVTGDVTGNLTGNVTGDVTGNITGEHYTTQTHYLSGKIEAQGVNNLEIESANGYIHLDTNNVYIGAFAGATQISNTTITTSAGDLTLDSATGNIVVDANIVSTGNANIFVQPNGTGDILFKNGTTSGNVNVDITNGQTMSWWIEPDNFVEIQGGRYASGLRVYDSSVGTGRDAGFQLDGFHFDKHFGTPQKLGGQFSVQLFGQGLPKESYGSFDEYQALGVHQKFEIKDNSDYYQGTVNVANNDATVEINDANLTANITAGDWIRIEGAVSDSAGYRMSGNLQCQILSVDSGNNEIELNLTSNSLSNLIAGSNLNATIMSNSSTAINMSAGTRDAVHTFTHACNQFGTDVAGNDRVDLKFQAKTVEFAPGLSASSVNALKAYDSVVYVNEDNNDIDFKVHGTSVDDIIKVDAGTNKLKLQGNHEYDGTTYEPYPGVEITSGGLLVEGSDYTGISINKRKSTTNDPGVYSLEVATNYDGTSYAAGGVAGSFGFAAYSENNGYVYPGTIAGIIGNDTANIDGKFTALGNNGVEIRTFDTGGKTAPYTFNTTQAAEFRAAHGKLMDGAFQWDYANSEVLLQTPTVNDNLKLQTTGTDGDIILAPNGDVNVEADMIVTGNVTATSFSGNGSGLAIDIGDLADVTLSNVVDGDYLRYNANANVFENFDIGIVSGMAANLKMGAYFVTAQHDLNIPGSGEIKLTAPRRDEATYRNNANVVTGTVAVGAREDIILGGRWEGNRRIRMLDPGDGVLQDGGYPYNPTGNANNIGEIVTSLTAPKPGGVRRQTSTFDWGLPRYSHNEQSVFLKRFDKIYGMDDTSNDRGYWYQEATAAEYSNVENLYNASNANTIGSGYGDIHGWPHLSVTNRIAALTGVFDNNDANSSIYGHERTLYASASTPFDYGFLVTTERTDSSREFTDGSKDFTNTKPDILISPWPHGDRIYVGTGAANTYNYNEYDSAVEGKVTIYASRKTNNKVNGWDHGRFGRTTGEYEANSYLETIEEAIVTFENPTTSNHTRNESNGDTTAAYDAPTSLGARATFHKAIVLGGYTDTERNALTATQGMVIWNTSNTRIEYYDGTNWKYISGTTV